MKYWEITSMIVRVNGEGLRFDDILAMNRILLNRKFPDNINVAPPVPKNLLVIFFFLTMDQNVKFFCLVSKCVC